MVGLVEPEAFLSTDTFRSTEITTICINERDSSISHNNYNVATLLLNILIKDMVSKMSNQLMSISVQ